jgi:hypothetical protein
MAWTRNVLTCAAAGAALLTAPLIAGRLQDEFTDWSEPVSLGPVVNTEFDELGATVSRDGLSLYFHSGRPGGFGGTDIWVSQRANEDDPWGPAQNLGPAVNTAFNENTPRLSLDGHWLYFASSRPGGSGGSDLYVSRRRRQRDDLAWEAVVNLGAGVNTSANEGGPALFEDDVTGMITLYFQSNRPGGLGGADIYASTLEPDGRFGAAALVEELSSLSADIVPCIGRDGLKMLITSTRPGSMPFPPPSNGLSFDLWGSTRATTGDRWSTPVNLGPVVNTPTNDGWAALSFDGTILYFATCRPGDPCKSTLTLDLYTSTRSKFRGAVGGSGKPPANTVQQIVQ